MIGALPLELRAAAVLALVLAAWLGLHAWVASIERRATDKCQAGYAAAARAQFTRTEHQGYEASAGFEAQSADITARQPHAQATLRAALAAPVSCTSGRLADVRVPAALLDGLRSAAAGPGADPAAASQPGGTVRPGP